MNKTYFDPPACRKNTQKYFKTKRKTEGNNCRYIPYVKGNGWKGFSYPYPANVSDDVIIHPHILSACLSVENIF